MVTRSIYIIIGAICLGAVIFAEGIQFSASVSKSTLSVNDRLIYELKLTSDGQLRAPDPTLPDFNGYFDIINSSQSNSYSIVNGHMSSTKVKKYTLLPSKPGTMTIGPSSIVINGDKLETDSFEILITTASVQAVASGTTQTAPQAQGNNPFQRLNPVTAGQVQGNVFSDATIDKKKVYIGEQITYTLNFYRRIQLWSNVEYEVPKLQGFWVEELPLEEQSVQELQGRRYYVMPLAKKALFPLQAGRLNLGAAKVGFVINPFDGNRVIETTPKVVTVLPLPEQGRPRQFSGVVGNFSLSVSMNQTDVQQHSPLTLHVTLSGKGNFKTVTDLDYTENPDYKLYKSSTSDEMLSGDTVAGSRTFEYIMIPKESGTYQTPVFTFHYFSPEQKAYKTLRTTSQEIVVTPSDAPLVAVSGPTSATKEEVALLREEIRYLKPIDRDKKSRFVGERWWFLGLCFLNLGLFLWSIGVELVKQFWRPDKRLLNKQRAFDIAQKKMKPLEIEIKENPSSISKVQNILLEFLSNRTGEPCLGMTQEAMRQTLNERGLIKNRVEEVVTHLDKLSFAVYAPAECESSELRGLFTKTEDLMKQLKGELS